MSKPWLKKVRRRQREIKSYTRQQFDYVISNAQEKGMIDEGVDTSYNISMPNPNEDAFVDLSQAFNQYANALTVLEANGQIEKNVSKSIIDLASSMLGIDEMQETEEDSLDVEDQSILEAKKEWTRRYTEAKQTDKAYLRESRKK